jgi:hypothetical protein
MPPAASAALMMLLLPSPADRKTVAVVSTVSVVEVVDELPASVTGQLHTTLARGRHRRQPYSYHPPPPTIDCQRRPISAVPLT